MTITADRGAPTLAPPGSLGEVLLRLQAHDVTAVKTQAAYRRQKIETVKARWSMAWHALAAWAFVGLVVAAAWWWVPGDWLVRFAEIMFAAAFGLAGLLVAVALSLRAVFADLFWERCSLLDLETMPEFAARIPGAVTAALGEGVELWGMKLESMNPGWLNAIADALEGLGRFGDWLADRLFDPQLWMEGGGYSGDPLCLGSWSGKGRRHRLPAMEAPAGRAQ